jgi:hypothetical protein
VIRDRSLLYLHLFYVPFFVIFEFKILDLQIEFYNSKILKLVFNLLFS